MGRFSGSGGSAAALLGGQLGGSFRRKGLAPGSSLGLRFSFVKLGGARVEEGSFGEIAVQSGFELGVWHGFLGPGLANCGRGTGGGLSWSDSAASHFRGLGLIGDGGSRDRTALHRSGCGSGHGGSRIKGSGLWIGRLVGRVGFSFIEFRAAGVEEVRFGKAAGEAGLDLGLGNGFFRAGFTNWRGGRGCGLGPCHCSAAHFRGISPVRDGGVGEGRAFRGSGGALSEGSTWVKVVRGGISRGVGRLGLSFIEFRNAGIDEGGLGQIPARAGFGQGLGGLAFAAGFAHRGGRASGNLGGFDRAPGDLGSFGRTFGGGIVGRAGVGLVARGRGQGLGRVEGFVAGISRVVVLAWGYFLQFDGLGLEGSAFGNSGKKFGLETLGNLGERGLGEGRGDLGEGGGGVGQSLGRFNLSGLGRGVDRCISDRLGFAAFGSRNRLGGCEF